MTYSVPVTQRAASLLSHAADAGMQDFSRLVHLCHYALETQPLDGMIVEFGCFNGDTAKLLSAITDKEVHVYDSFEGLPDVGEGFTPGTMRTMADTLLANFFRDGVRPPSIHLGWFDRLTPKDIPAQIAFAHLDGDLYASTMQAWHLIYDRLVSGAVVLVDDYDDPYFEGPRRACDEFLADKPERAVPLMGMCGLPSYKALVVKSV